METPISKPKSDRATTEQLQFYVSFCRERPQLLSGKNSPKSPRLIQELWTELTDGLNALRGPTRTVSKWKETLGVWKSQLRTRARRLKMSQRVTGGGPYSKPMSYFEEMALSTFGLAAVEGATSSGSFGLTVPQQAISHECVVEVPLLSPGGPTPSPECSLPSPSATLFNDSITENETHSEDVLLPMVRPTYLERKKLIAELIDNINKREEREKQQQRETLLTLQCLNISVTELVNEIKKVNKQTNTK